MKNFTVLLLLSFVFSAKAQNPPMISGITGIVQNDEARIWKASNTEYKKIIYYPLSNHYRLCKGTGFSQLPSNANINKKCRCNDKVKADPDISEIPLTENLSRKIESLKMDLSNNEWIIYFENSQQISGKNVAAVSFLSDTGKALGLWENERGKFAGIEMGPGNTCALDHVDTSKVQIFSKVHSEMAQNMVDEICAANVLKSNFRILSAPVSSASATFYDNKRYILYSEDYLYSKTRRSKTKWTAYFIFAHEVGHHLNGDNLESQDPDERRQNELAADKWAGHTLHLLHAKKRKALAWVKKINDTNDPNYPSRRERIKAVKKGWKFE